MRNKEGPLKLPEKLSDLIQYELDNMAVTSREGKRREFKQGFVQADFSDYTKVLASFANADGGVLIFGISDKPKQIVGVDLQIIPDEADWVNRLREDFDPEIIFETKIYQVKKTQIFAMAVDPCPLRPVICRRSRSKQAMGKNNILKDIEVIRDGTIYFRYAGQTRPIAFTELAAMLDERERKRMAKLMGTLQAIEHVGFDRAGVVEVSPNGASNVYVSRETAKDLTFVDQARIVNEKGAPAYVVLGQVQLNHVIHAPLEEADKNLPGEVAERLRPLVMQLYGAQQPFVPSQVTQLLRHLKLDANENYCVYEHKLRRRYVTRAGVQAVREFIAQQPLEALRVFGSRRAVQEYENKVLGKA